jgi:hypothetical protein
MLMFRWVKSSQWFVSVVTIVKPWKVSSVSDQYFSHTSF